MNNVAVMGAVAGSVVALDWASKVAANETLGPDGDTHPGKAYGFDVAMNYGAAGGAQFMSGRTSGMIRAGISVGLAGLMLATAKSHPPSRIQAVATGLFVGAGLANGLEGTARGGVTDFIKIGPARANVADVFALGSAAAIGASLAQKRGAGPKGMAVGAAIGTSVLLGIGTGVILLQRNYRKEHTGNANAYE